MDEKFRSRKFGLAVVFTTVGAVGLFNGNLGGGEFIALAATVLGLYSIANVAEKRAV